MRKGARQASLADAARNRAEIDRSLLRGIAWTGAAKWTTQVITWAATLTLARLLTPEDFGIMALGTLYLGFVSLFNEMGIGTAVVAFRDLDRDDLRQLHTLSIGLGVAGLLVGCGLAFPLGAAFRSEQLPAVVAVLGLSFVFSGFKTVPNALIQKAFGFRALGAIEAASALTMAVCEVSLAFAGFGYWSLVVGELIGIGIGAGLAFARMPVAFAIPRLEKLRRVLRFASHLLAGRVLWYAYSNADFAVVGRVLGQQALGVYRIAWDFSNIPLRKITELIGRVLPPVFSAVQHQPAELRRYLLNITSGLSLLTFPACLGLTLVADDFVKVALGEKWLDAIIPLRLLSVYISLRTINTLIPQILTVIGETKFLVKNGIFAVVLLPISFLIGTRWGMAGVAWAWMLAYPLVAGPMYVKLHRTIGLTTGPYLRSIWPATSGCLVMAAVVLGVRFALPADASPALRLIVQIAAGAAAYAATLLVAHRPRIVAAWKAVRSLRGPVHKPDEVQTT